jgi:hypothetical protein
MLTGDVPGRGIIPIVKVPWRPRDTVAPIVSVITRTSPATLLCAAALLASAAWVIVQHASVALLPYDDAFITYRYVENVTHGASLTYNPGVRVWGFTSPLFTFWLTALKLGVPGVDLPVLAVRGNAIFMLLTGMAALLLLYRQTANLGVACVGACVLLVHPSLLSISTGGMESGLFTSLVLFTFLAMVRGRPAAAGALIGLAFLARPEGVLLLPIAVLWYWRTPRQLALAILVGTSVAGAWLAFAAAYYHSLVPLPVIAKAQPLYPLDPGYALRIIAGYIGPTLFGPSLGPSPARNLAVAVVLVGSTALCAASPRMRAHGAWMPGLFAILAIALYHHGNPMFFEWYWPPILATVLLAVLLGGTGLTSLMASGSGVSSTAAPVLHRIARAIPGWTAPVWIAIVTLVAYGDNAGGHSKSIRFVDQDGTRLRVVTYARIGRYLSAVTSGTESVAAPEIGALGYYFNGRVIDACGLVSPEIIPFLPVPPDQRAGPAVGALSVEMVQATDPDWVVSMPIFVRESLLRSEWFNARYELVMTVALHKVTFDSSNVLVFKRRAGSN